MCLVTGLLPLDAAGDVTRRMAPILLFLVAITVLAELAEVAKVFDVAALHSSRLARGRTGLLFLLVALLATVTTVLLGLDTTAVLLTPVVLSMSVQLDLPADAVRAADRLAGQHREPAAAGLEPHQPARAGPAGADSRTSSRRGCGCRPSSPWC